MVPKTILEASIFVVRPCCDHVTILVARKMFSPSKMTTIGAIYSLTFFTCKGREIGLLFTLSVLPIQPDHENYMQKLKLWFMG